MNTDGAPLGPIRPTGAAIERLELSEADRLKLFAGSAKKLLKIKFG